MTQHSDDDYRVRPIPQLTGRQATRVGVSTACMAMSDVLMARVPTTDDDNFAAGDWMRFADQINLMRIELLHRCVTAELAAGTSWETIAALLGDGISVEAAKKQFGHCDLTHLSEGQDVWDVLAETCINPVPDTCAPTPGLAALELDDRYHAWHHPGEAAPPQPHAVTANL